MIRVIIDGACGRMGKMITQGVSQQEDMQIVGAIEFSEHPQLGQDVGEVAGIGAIGVPVTSDLPAILDDGDVVIEFTSPSATVEHLQNVVDAGKRMVIATTGYDEEELVQVHALAPQIPCVMAANMSVGINVMLQAIQAVANVLGDDYDLKSLKHTIIRKLIRRVGPLYGWPRSSLKHWTEIFRRLACMVGTALLEPVPRRRLVSTPFEGETLPVITQSYSSARVSASKSHIAAKTVNLLRRERFVQRGG